mmetsp:Transcript_70949/g.224115  ORF Transcript_70949/g.224115 Transcript_70949/m.224115 type:complete len:375 (-) Transcript_70949:91-1215(-)
MGAACCKEGPESPVEKLENPGALAMSEYGSEKDRQDVVRDMRSEHGQQREPEPERESGAPEFSISIVGARGLRPSDWLPRVSEPACYCEVKANGEVLFTTAKSENENGGCEPVWAAAFDVLLARVGSLEFAVYGEDPFGSDFLGKARLETQDYGTDGFNGELKLEDGKADEACIRVKVKLAGKGLPPGPAAGFRARIERPSADTPWAIGFDTRDEVQLRVMGIVEGAVSEYNSGAKPQRQVNVGDHLLEVNGVTGSADSMLAEFATKCSVDCVISRSATCTFLVDFGEASTPKGIDLITSAGGFDFWVIRSIADDGKGKGQLQPGDRVIALGPATNLAADLPQQVREASGKVLVTVSRSVAGNSKGSPPHWAFE